MNLFGRKSGCVFSCIFLLFLNTACGKELMKTSVSLTAYNHTESGVGSYIVTLADGNSVEAGYLAPGEGGAGKLAAFQFLQYGSLA